MSKAWKIKLSFVSPQGTYVDITGKERGKRANYDYVPGALLLMVASHGHGKFHEIDPKHQHAMMECLDKLFPKWREEWRKYEPPCSSPDQHQGDCECMWDGIVLPP